MAQWIWKNIVAAFRFALEVVGAACTLGQVLKLAFSLEQNQFSAKAILVVALIALATSFVWNCLKPFRRTYHLNGGILLKVRIGSITRKYGCAIVVGTNNELVADRDRINKNCIQYALQLDTRLEQKIQREFSTGKHDGTTVGFGTVISVPQESVMLRKKRKALDRVFHFLVMSRLEANKNASTTMVELDNAMFKYFQQVGRLNVPNQRLEVPLIGTGVAGVYTSGNSKNDVAVMIVREFMRCRQNGQCNNIKELTICISWSDIKFINWPESEGKLDLTVKNCQGCKGFK